MSEQHKKISRKAGLPPGTLVHIGKKHSEKTKITIFDYSPADFTELICKSPEDCLKFKDSGNITWINVDGLHNVEDIALIGEHFSLHPLLLEDILNTRHRPKAEDFDNCIFLTMKMLGISVNKREVLSEQVSIVLGKDWIISFQEQAGDIFDTVRQRLREGKGNARKNGADYLLYRLLDCVVDNYFFVTEHISHQSEKLEERVLAMPDDHALREIQNLKKLLVSIRKAVSPLRDAVSFLQKDDSGLIKKNTLRYLRDVYEHIIHVNDSIETQRDILGGIMDLYLSGVSNKMNQVMKVLTIIATIFIPLTFVAGIYGMNFERMPELHWKYGYLYIWIVMLILSSLMVVYFRKKKWL